MSQSAEIRFRIDEKTLATLDRLATTCDRSRGGQTDKLLAEAAAAELAKIDFIDEGIADADAGRTISHKEFMARLDAEFGYSRNAEPWPRGGKAAWAGSYR